MKKPGDRSKYTETERIQIAQEYTTTDIGLKEIASKYQVTPATIRRYVNLYQKEVISG